MLINHEIQTVVNNMRKDELFKCFTEAYTVACQLIELRSTLQQWKQGSLDDDELFDSIDELNYFSYNSLLDFSRWANSKDTILNKYLSRTMSYFEVVKKNVQIVSDSACVPTDEEYNLLLKGLYSIISGILYFIIHEFNLKTTILAAETKDDVPVDEIVSHYCASTNKDLLDFVLSVCELGDKFKFKLDFFDDYPNKEEDFERVMGPLVVGIDEATLTISLVDDVIAGKITPAELLEITNSYDEV